MSTQRRLDLLFSFGGVHHSRDLYLLPPAQQVNWLAEVCVQLMKCHANRRFDSIEF